ncbi:MAG: NTP transferase domain-containing protein [bacterium]|nr:NTP transferase domain-containing protein [bacterium]
MSAPNFDVLVLAGRRDANDELARAAGATHRVLLDIAGEPMLARVLTTLATHDRTDAILLCSDAPDLLKEVPQIADMIEQSRVCLLPAAATPSNSVLAGIDALAARGPAGKPLLVTTADHALLDHEMLDYFLDAACASGADVTVGLVPETLIAQRFPEAKRTYLPFRGERYSGANLFAFMTPAARNVALFWRAAEQHRKSPWRMVRTFGLLSLLLFLLRRLDLVGAFRRVSATIGARVDPVRMPMAEAAVDVDKVSDWQLVRQILEERARR